ncbi:MAG TPA: two-component system activity regulator YycH [Bacillota bacterium]|nr:two-component system activity regulator YycH [Bacillota bacterium]
MRLETFKTILLIGLIGLSLILTFSLWSYQNEYNGPHNTNPAYIPESDAGGEVKTKRDVIIPSKAIFHMDGQHYGFDHPSRLVNFYKEIQHWTLTEFVAREDNEFHLDTPYIEMNYPEAFPIEIIKSLFSLADDIELPRWNFDQILFSLEEEKSAVSLYFLSVDERNYIHFTVYDQSAYLAVEGYLDQKKHLVEYTEYNTGHDSFYIPVRPPKLRNQTLTVDIVETNVFVDALFKNPSVVVTPNIGESYFIDGQRDMRVVDNGLRLEFTNPLQNTSERMSSIEIIEQSLADINDHKGWTSDFYVEGIEKSVNRIVYQMYYEDYPVFQDHAAATTIEQQWRNQQLYKYNRPLFHIVSPLGGDEKELESGNDVIYFLEQMDKYHMEKVKDVKVGYYVTEIDGKQYSITLEPAWFVLYNGSWQRLKFDDLNAYDEGGM